MRLIASILTLSLSTYALAFDFALAAPIKRSERVTPTITKTVYQTEVRRLFTSFKDHDVRNESVVSDPSTSISNAEVFEDVHDDTASFMATVFLGPRGPSGQKPTIWQLPVTGVPVSFTARQVGFVHLDNDTKYDETLHSELNTVDRRNTGLYHIKINLASEGYISIFMSNSTASAFCESELEQDLEGGPKGELQLAVRNSTKVVAIPVHKEAATRFCFHFKNAEGVDSPASGKVPGSATATSSDSERKTPEKTPSETIFESVSKTSKHASTADTASRTEADASASATSATSTSKTTTLNTFDITHEIKTSKSTKHMSAEATVSESGSTTIDDGTDKTVSKTSEADDSSSGGNTTKSTKHKSMSVTALESDLATSETATDVSSKHKTKSTASEADEDASKTVEASTTLTISKAANADSSELEESASHSAAKSKISGTNETEDNAESAASIQEYRGPAADPTDPDAFPTPKATPAAMPISTTTDGPFTEASMNSFYSYIRSFVETAPDPSSNIGSTDQTSIITTDSSNGAVRRGILIAPTAALMAIRAETDRHSLGNSMIYTSDYSWKGTVSTGIAPATASSNAAIGRLKPPSLLWHRWYPTTTTKSVFSRKRNSGLDEEPEQEDEGFFKIDVEDQEPTGVSVDVSRVEEETAVATKLAHKQEDKDGDDQGTNAKDGDKDEEEGEDAPADEETTPDKEAQTDEGAAGDDETTTFTSTKSKLSHTKTAVDEEDTRAPTADTSTNVEEKATSTEKKPAEDDEEATPTVTSSKDVKEKATSTKKQPAGADDEATPTSKAANNTPPENEDALPSNDDEEPETDTSTSDNTPTTTSHKAKSTKSATSDSDDDADEKPATTTKSTHKSKVTIPSLASGASFAFPTITNTAINSMTPPLPTPPPAPTGTAPMPIPTQPIIWDPDCPRISTSTLTAPNGVTTALPMTVGLGCWRTVPVAESGGNETSGANRSMIKSKAWKILSDRQNLQLGVVSWMVIGLIGFQ
ncbi:hypothetical protein BKA58DRAFT_466156 [Alternaria rosae]|uniref:uncharacterized protein n=1 Tax=Alternaria rosae TaxID=1187941 RepID=UPI001E8D7E19|nr:uncharacterized protein BKA58DRAFT_466156 [Alternaria rosae]KAH6878483.1 hypothetical protein BKA58DRAFT_466156 [Alternaria rosae]